jgi:hypothetical protein
VRLATSALHSVVVLVAEQDTQSPYALEVTCVMSMQNGSMFTSPGLSASVKVPPGM